MSAPTSSAPAAPSRVSPEIIVLAGCLIALITFGPRASVGLFQIPMTTEFGWGRDTFSLAIAFQNLLWGVGQPFAGAVADRFGAFRVLCFGALLYAIGLVVMAYASTPSALHLGAGILIGFGLSGCSFNLVLGAFGKLLPEQWRPMAFGAGTAAGSFGQFLFPPIGNVLIDSFGWHQALVIFAGSVLLVMPLALALATRPGAAGQASAANVPNQSIRQALTEAFQHRSYVLLVLGFFTCGFQLAFITAHLPAYLKDAGLSAAVGGWTLAVIGLANAFGSLGSGWLSTRMSKRWLLAWIYFGRSIAIAAFILLPASPVTSIAFGISIGLLWLSTVPPTSSLVMLMFGTRYMAMLYGFAFFSHQVGGFLGVWLGGELYEIYGNYTLVWWLSIALGIASALINLPIKERPVERGPALQPAE
ncbi:MFS transporter [Microvirga guangxiensis]|uniref:Predicted arabinose efflux permease, MFS family n=1 Tax=Microvirga guangxiensis TaxID=549386 RepID=A0A1G5JNP0_9HYPH|nr:MFS transporter [Microvirga guangxiensis]SCY89956.1 Predicted arabinose efflux permease, MFS family [Microvirga guangxiensis]